MPQLDSTSQPLAVAGVNPVPPQRQQPKALSYDALEESDANAPPGLSAAPTFSALLHAFQRRWALALTLAVLAAVGGALAVIQLFPARYTVQARFEVPAQANTPVLIAESGVEDYPHFKNKVASLLKNPLVIQAALQDEQIQALAIVRGRSDAVDWLENALKTDYLLGPEVLRVSLSGDQPEELARLLNALGAAFLSEMEQREKTRRLNLLAALKTNQRFEEDKLRQKQITLRQLEEARGLEDLDTAKIKFQAALTELGALRKSRIDKRQDQINTQEEVHALQEKEKLLEHAPIPVEHFEEIFKSDLHVQAFLQDKGKLQKEMVDIQRVAPGSVALLAEKQQTMERMDKELERLKEKMMAGLDRELRNKMRAELKGTIAHLQERLKMLKTQEVELKNEVRRMEEDAQKLNPSNRPRTLEMLALENEIGYTQAALQELGKKIATLTVEPARGSRVTLLQKAEAPRGKDSSRQTKIAGTAGITLFGLMLLGVSFWEFRSRRISQTDEVVRGLGLSLVGTLPSLPVRVRRPFIQGNRARDRAWQDRLSEAVDTIRTRLLHTSRGGGFKVIMVTSAVSGEGKTALACHLAASLARARKNTLLVDGDLRHPAIHQMLELPLAPGLAEVLRGEVVPMAAVHPTLVNRLWTMPAGRCDGDALQALVGESVGTLFAHLREQFDFVIVDSCPVLPVTDSHLLGQHVDTVLFSILRDVSRTPSVYAAQQCLQELGIPLLGAVVIGAKADPIYSTYMTSAHN
jgi:capsular exopolysaccharide synthesis family protein